MPRRRSFNLTGSSVYAARQTLRAIPYLISHAEVQSFELWGAFALCPIEALPASLAPVWEYAMVHTEHTEVGVVLAVLATFIAVIGIAVVIHGMLFDENGVTLSGAATIALGVIASAAFLNLWPGNRS